MSVAPQPIDINETVKNLGFQVIGKYDSKGAKVNLKTKDILNKQLSLAHYTNSLAQNFVTDAFVAHALSFLERKQQKETKRPTFTKAQLYETVQRI